MTILVVGSANMDLVVTAARIPQPGETLLGEAFATYCGGKGANQAVAAARAGGKVAFVGRRGRDAFGHVLHAALASDAIDLSDFREVEEPTGVASIVTAADGQNAIVVAPGANARMEPAALDARQFAGAKTVLSQLEIPLACVFRAAELCRQAGGTFILDPAPAQPLSHELLRLTDWLTPNESEARALLGLATTAFDATQAAVALQQRGARGVIVKLDKEGAMLLTPGAGPVAIPAFSVATVDTTAAGDAFNGAFAVALAEGKAPELAARFACAAAALSVTRRGAQPSMPTRAEIEAFLRERGAT